MTFPQVLYLHFQKYLNETATKAPKNIDIHLAVENETFLRDFSFGKYVSMIYLNVKGIGKTAFTL
jgi:hypothetical protein